MRRLSSDTSGTKVSIDFTGLLQLLFIALKLMGYINWSWLWVLSPLWISVMFLIIVVVVIELVENRPRRALKKLKKLTVKKSQENIENEKRLKEEIKNNFTNI